MGYFNTTYYNSLMHADVKRDLNGTSISKEKGTDNKSNNTSAYNHDYYIHHKEKWQDNAGDDKSGLKEGDFDIDAAALDVIRGKYGNGQARKDALGDDYEMIQKRVNEMYKSGKFGDGTNTDANSSSDTASSKASESSGASSSGKWYTKYNDRIKDAKATKAQKEAQEAESKRQQEEDAKETKSKNKNRR